jgi:hypothetical protein
MRIFALFPKSNVVRTALALTALAQILTGCGEDAAGPAGDPDAQLVLLDPKGGETFHVGDSLKVRWKAQGKGLTEISSVALWISPDSGDTWILMKNASIAPTDADWGAFGWKIPANLLNKGASISLAGDTKVLVRVQDYQNSSDPHKTASLPEPIAVLEPR